jgi:subtilisin family serine protease
MLLFHDAMISGSAVALLAAALLPWSAWAAPPPPQVETVADEYLVPSDQAEAAAAATGGSVEVLGLGWALLRIDSGSETAPAVAAGVDLYPNPVLVPQEEPLQDLQWGLAKVRAPAAWEVTPGRPGIVVAVADTGTDLEHPELAPRLWDNPGERPGNGADDDGNGFVDDAHGWDFRGGDSRPDDVGYHGTMMSGVLAAAIDGRGVAGVAPRVRLMPLRVCDEVCPDGDVIAALAYAVDNGADVINISLGRASLGADVDAPLRQAVKAAGSAGVLVVAAAGNQATDADVTPLVPAAFPGNAIISVAATDPDDGLASFSNWGSESVDLGAPGTNIVSTTPLDYESSPRHGSLSGTSPATPHVAAAAALIRSANPCAPPSMVRKTVLATVDSAPDLEGRTVSGGRLDAAAAVAGALDRYQGEMDVEAAASPAYGGSPLAVELVGDADCDPTGKFAGYRWTFGDGGAADGRRLVHIYDEPGIYTARVTVRSPVGTEGRATVSVIVGLPFEDLGGTIFAKEIAWLSATGITLGCDEAGTRFCPQAGVRRGQMASFLTRAFDLPAGPDAFGDDEGSTHEDAINALAATGITQGCTTISFCPDEEVSRAQMASFLSRALDLPTGPDVFGDDEGSTHEDAINALAATGITQGCTTTSFCPEEKVTRGQMAAFLYRALAD